MIDLISSPAPVYLARSRYVATLKGLDVMLGGPVRRCRWARNLEPGAVVLAWGRKRTGLRAEAFAARHGLPLLHLEDGFLRSLGPGPKNRTYSVSLDDVGIYYDASRPSRLEQLIATPLDADQEARAGRILQLWRAGRISKYNHAREYAAPLPERYVLAVDQTLGDGSIRYGMASAASFHRMLEAALDEHPKATILLKVHPEVVSGRKKGHFDLAAIARLGRVQVLGDAAHPVRLLEQAAALYTVTSQMGFEGLLWGKPVRTFGMPFYAGWGLTQDEQPAPSRRGAASLAQLIHAALVTYPRYVDPETNQRCEPERVMEWMGLQRTMRERLPAVVHACGVPKARRQAMRQLFQGAQVVFPRRPEHIPADAVRMVQGDTESDAPAISIKSAAPVGACVEAPWTGTPSARLEREPEALVRLLEEMDFPPALLARARSLHARLRDIDLSMHAESMPRWTRPAAAARVVLVLGNSADCAQEQERLSAIRQKESTAYIVYKPVPSVLTTEDARELAAAQSRRNCDEIFVGGILPSLLAQVDALWTVRSTLGFDALLRGVEVHCEGRPFYAGWGLTIDESSLPHRNRTLSLEQLIAGAVIEFPMYVGQSTVHFTTPERVLDELQTRVSHAASQHPFHRLWRNLGLSAQRRAR